MISPRASPVFSFVILVTVGLFGLVGVVLVQPNLIVGLLGQEMAGHISGHFRSLHHRVHDLTFSLIIGTAAVGVLVQLRRPLENVAGQLMAIVAWVGLGLTSGLTNRWIPFAPAPILGPLTFLAAILHPAGRDLFRSFSGSRVNRAMVALVIIAAVPLLAFASTNIGLQRTVTNDHAALGHYGFMAAFSFTVIGVGLLASLRPEGWRLTAWVAGSLLVFLGLASVVFADVDSSFGLVWAIAAIAWGVAFIATAELARRGGPYAARLMGRDIRSRTGSRSTTDSPRWVKVLGIIAIALGLLFAIMHLTSGGRGVH